MQDSVFSNRCSNTGCMDSPGSVDEEAPARLWRVELIHEVAHLERLSQVVVLVHVDGLQERTREEPMATTLCSV